MEVSIIVPTYNRAHIVPETINSILNQTFTDFELIIVDNCSEDNTEDIVRCYIENDQRVRYFKHPNYGVIAVNRNFGAQQAQGDYIAFCDDDDLWEPHKLELQVRELQKNPQIAMVCTNGRAFYENGTREDMLVDFKSQLLTFEILLRENRVIGSSVLVRKNVFDDIGGFDENRDLISVEDYDLWMRISLGYKIKFLNQFLVRYRIHSANASGILLQSLSFFRFKQFKIIFQKYESSHPRLVMELLVNYLHRLRLQKQIFLISQNKKILCSFLRNNTFTMQQKIWVMYRIVQEMKFLEVFFIQFKDRMNSYNVGRLIVRFLAKIIKDDRL